MKEKVYYLACCIQNFFCKYGPHLKKTLLMIIFMHAILGKAQKMEFFKDINITGMSGPRHFVESGGLLFFIADDGIHDWEFWVTDGSSEGTHLVKDINPDGNGGEIFPISYKGKLYFSAINKEYGDEMWVSDGTEEGTYLFKDFNPLGAWGQPGAFVVFEDQLFFAVNDGNLGSELWVTDGTESGTSLVKDIDPRQGSMFREVSPVVFKDKFYFFAQQCVDYESNCAGIALWSSDGTEAGTQMVKDINTISSNVRLKNLMVSNGKLYFTGDDGVHGNELWVSDGTEAGTKMVKDINKSGFSNPHDFLSYKDKLFFTASNQENGSEMWMTDGTEGGTSIVKDILPGEDYSYPSAMTIYDNKIYFSARNSSNKSDLWISDGTESGTQKITNERFVSDLVSLKVYNHKLYFLTEKRSNELQLWVSDGTEDGTNMLVSDSTSGNAFQPFYYSSNELVVYNNAMYFSANYSSHGNELWRITDAGYTSINIPLNMDFMIYPNPASAQLFVKGELNIGKNITIELVDNLGRKTALSKSHVTHVSESEISIDISNIPKGYFVLSIINENTVINRTKLLKID